MSKHNKQYKKGKRWIKKFLRHQKCRSSFDYTITHEEILERKYYPHGFPNMKYRKELRRRKIGYYSYLNKNKLKE